MTWRPLPSALLFAVLGPLAGAGIVLLLLAPAIADLGPFDADAPVDLLFGAFVVGLPPMAATGLFVGLGAERGSSVPRLLLRAAVAGFLLSGLSAVLLAMLGPVVSPTWQMMLAVAVIGGVSAVVVCGIAALLFRRRAAGGAAS
ncbi:MAG: hypothetical protein IT534_11480 [Bauldia sp.]|nr:hypothetical protein [Bauldia sp.]